MGQFLNSINEVRKNYSKYDDWEQKQADERAKKEYLAKNLQIPEDKLELTKKRAETVIRATEMMDARSEDNCQNMEMLTSNLAAIPVLALSVLQIPLTDYAADKATFKINEKIRNLSYKVQNPHLTSEERQAMNNEITDLVEKSSKISKKVRLYSPLAMMGLMLVSAVGMILWGNSKQKEASRIGRYQAKQNELKDEKNFVIYTPEQLEKAKEIAKNIPDEKEKNSISKMIKELKNFSNDKKAYKKWLSEKDPNEIEKLKSVNLQLNSEAYQRAKEDQELIVDAVKEINVKAEEYSENVENSFDTLSTLSWLIATPLGFGINKLMKLVKADKKIRNIVSVAVPVLTSVGISMFGTLEEKNASRVGRYKARQDLLKNPARLMAYSDEEMKQAENVKAKPQKQSFLEKLGGSFTFLSTYIKDKSAYNKYKKITQKQNEKLNKALKEVEITDAQKKDAQALQKNVFRAFDEVDEMSQRYSEDTEAGTEIAKEIASSAWSVGTILGSAFLAVSVIKGKFPLVKVANWLTNLSFDAKSPIKLAMNNINNVVKNSDKKTVQKFQESIVNGNLKNFLGYERNKAFKEAVEPLFEEFAKIGTEGIANSIANGGKKDMAAVFSELFKSHFKQTAVAKWTRNMVAQSAKLWAKKKASNADVEIPKDMQEKLGMNFNYKNYKTLINTGIVASVPLLGTIIAVPYAFNAWLTDIQKKAGKIGIMKAMDKIDDPRVFASETTATTNPTKTPQPKPTQVAENTNSQLLDKFKQSAV